MSENHQEPWSMFIFQTALEITFYIESILEAQALLVFDCPMQNVP